MQRQHLCYTLLLCGGACECCKLLLLGTCPILAAHLQQVPPPLSLSSSSLLGQTTNPTLRNIPYLQILWSRLHKEQESIRSKYLAGSFTLHITPYPWTPCLLPPSLLIAYQLLQLTLGVMLQTSKDCIWMRGMFYPNCVDLSNLEPVHKLKRFWSWYPKISKPSLRVLIQTHPNLLIKPSSHSSPLQPGK